MKLKLILLLLLCFKLVACEEIPSDNPPTLLQDDNDCVCETDWCLDKRLKYQELNLDFSHICDQFGEE